MAYADVYDLMDMTEELVSSLVYHVTGGYTTKFHTQHGEEYEVNWKSRKAILPVSPFLDKNESPAAVPLKQL
jgi:lysyl-tRNA synthetase class 2